jgi:medium-chain acyl-[acyl-carrier-protein] hydrolase
VKALPEWIDVCPVELPGHGTRMDGHQLTTVEQIVSAVLPDVKQLAAPLAIFGHSMGARLGYELCRALGSTPIHLFASAAPAPHVPRRRHLAQLSRSALVAELTRMNPATAEVYEDAELVDLLLPIIRTDLALSEAYRGSVEPPIDVPITVLTSTTDEDVTLEEAQAWGQATSRPFAEPIVYEGGHFFLEAHAKSIHEVIAAALSGSRA